MKPGSVWFADDPFNQFSNFPASCEDTIETLPSLSVLEMLELSKPAWGQWFSSAKP